MQPALNHLPIVVAYLAPPEVLRRASAEFDAVLADGADLAAAALLDAARAHQARAIVIAGSHQLDAGLIAQLPDSVRIVATSTVGFDHIDVAAAQARGLIVTNTPDVLTACTADLTLMLMLNACRRGAEYAAIMRDGWRRRFAQSEMLGLRMSGRTLGIFGIGRAVAQRARTFEMPIVYCNRHRLAPELEQGARYFATLDAMLPECDLLSLHAPAGDATANIIDRAALARMRRGAVLVNTARGRLVDEDALMDALRSGQLFAAGLDVFQHEPDFDLRLQQLPNVFLTPHMASATVETRRAMGMRALDNVAAVLRGDAALDPLW
ncbi:MAG: D-glycerate dehydrogenase [Nevskia sp.]|nr:D-glycerate dehydrogenase [Nevskia sp.]